MNSQSEWPTRMKNEQRTGYSADVFAPPLQLAWKFEMKGYIWAGPTIVKRRVYVPGNGLYAFDLEDGELVWKVSEITTFGNTSVAAWQDSLVICGNQNLYIVDAQTGDIRVRVKSDSVYSSPCIYGGMIYWGSVDGNIYASDVHTGTVKWTYNTGSAIHFTPSAIGDTIYVAGHRTVYALNTVTGHVKWRWGVEGEAQDTATIYKKTLLVAVKRWGIVGLNTLTGELRWQCDIELGPSTAPCVTPDGIAYVASRRLHAVSCESGEEFWTSDEYGFTTSAPIVVGEHIFIGGGNDRAVYAFDRRAGEKVWEFQTGDMVFSTPAYADGRLVIGCHDGYVYCFAEA